MPSNEEVDVMPVLRQVVGDTLRALRLRQRRTLREVSASARVSLGYLSEVERGQKEPSSELLAAIAAALEVELSDLFAEVASVLRREEKLASVGILGGGRLAAVPGAGSARITPAPPADNGGGVAVRTVSIAAA
jgi:transcriptional regulator with XRE-family HTH domain